MSRPAGEKVYIGDGAYAMFDGYGITVSAERGYTEHYVYLEPSVMANLLRVCRESGMTLE